MTDPRMSALQVWVLAMRLRTLPAAIAPVVVGVALAWREGGLHVPAALAALVGAVLIQIGTNFANDYFDFVNGADTAERVGPTRATQAGLVRPEVMKRAFIGTFAAAVVVGAYLLWRGGWPLAVIGASSVAFGILYTGGPRPLGYLGLGDLLVLVFFGPVAVAGTVYVQTLSLSWTAVIAGLGPGLLSCAILVVNNLRDIDTDRKAGKNTLAVRFGPAFARAEYALCILGAGLVPFVLWLALDSPGTTLLALLPAPLAVVLVAALRRGHGQALNPLLGRTGQLLALYSLGLSAGWLL